MSLKETLSTYWVHLQAALLPWLDEAPDGPLTPRHKQLVAVLGLIRIEALLPSWPVLVGRPPAEQLAEPLLQRTQLISPNGNAR